MVKDYADTSAMIFSLNEGKRLASSKLKINSEWFTKTPHVLFRTYFLLVIKKRNLDARVYYALVPIAQWIRL